MTGNGLVIIGDATLPAAKVEKTSAEYAALSRADNTKRSYRTQCAKFDAWCAARGVPSMPAAPEVVREYLTDLANAGQRVATLAAALTAIKWACSKSGTPLNMDAEKLSDTWDGIRRDRVAEQRQSTPITRDDARDMLSLMGAGLDDVRDRAIIAFGLVAGRRASELSGLDLGHAGGSEGADGFVKIDERGAEITLVRSKSSQDKVVTFAVPRASAPSAIGALEAWIAAAGVQPGTPLFRGVNRHGRVSEARLSYTGIYRIIKTWAERMAKARGLSTDDAIAFAKGFGGHSLRVGFAVEAVNSGVEHAHIANHLGHASVEMTRRYADKADRWQGRAVAGVGF